jgi:hypothetical protein
MRMCLQPTTPGKITNKRAFEEGGGGDLVYVIAEEPPLDTDKDEVLTNLQK